MTEGGSASGIREENLVATLCSRGSCHGLLFYAIRDKRRTLIGVTTVFNVVPFCTTLFSVAL
jgi:hypothetical protein